MHAPDRRKEQKQRKRSVIEMSSTVIDPRTVVVHLQHTTGNIEQSKPESDTVSDWNRGVGPAPVGPKGTQRHSQSLHASFEDSSVFLIIFRQFFQPTRREPEQFQQ